MATLFPSSSIGVRTVQTLEVVHVIKLPGDLSGPVFGFQWSPSSRHVLVAVADQVHVFSALDAGFHAVLRNPVPPSAKPSYVGFGSDDSEVCVCSSFGLKLTIFSLVSSRAVEIANPKFYTPATACRGFSLRPESRHLAILTRTSGRDMVSIHHPASRDVQRSWRPDTVDAQGLMWTRDGKWLLIWESAAQGHKLLFYTPDGHIFRSWSGSQDPSPELKDRDLGAGIRLVQQSADATRVAVGDSSRCICVFDMTTLGETMRLHHPSSIFPKETLRVCQDHLQY